MADIDPQISKHRDLVRMLRDGRLPTYMAIDLLEKRMAQQAASNARRSAGPKATAGKAS